MLYINTAFVMFLFAVGYKNVREMERLSTSIVALIMVMIAVWIEPSMEIALSGQTLGFLPKMSLMWFVIITGWCSLRYLEDRKSTPEKGVD